MCTLSSACSTGSEISSAPKTVNFLSDDDLQNVERYDLVEFRAQDFELSGSAASATEVLGAVCDLMGNGFTLQITTPAKVNVPMYRGTAQVISARCTSRDQTAQATFEPQNITTNPKPNPLKGGLIGIAVVQAAAVVNKSSRDQTQDRFDFPHTLKVNFNQPQPDA